ncbi:MAG: MFS transporter [Actinomycetota bacterium]
MSDRIYATPSTGSTGFSGWRILALATIAMGLTGPGQTIGVSVFIDQFADDLDLSKNAISGGYALGTLCGSLTLPTVGRWIDRYGVRRAMTLIATLFAGGLAYMSGVQGLATLTIGFFFIRMLGQGSLSLVSSVTISRWFDRRRGFALGIAMTVSSALMALVPVALSFTIDEVGWRSAWLVASGTVGVIVIPLAWFGIIDRPAAVGQFPDGEPSANTTDAGHEWGVDRDVVLRTRAFWILALATSLASMLVTALNFHQIALLGESGFSETEAAIMFLPQVLGSSVGSPGMGLALDRVGTRYAPAFTLVMLAGSLLLAGWVTSTAGVVVYAVWLGLQSGMVRTLGAALLPAWFGTKHLGAIQGAMTFLGVLASAAGPIAFAVTESATDSFRTSATLWAIAPLVAAFFALSKRPVLTPNLTS